MSLKNAETQALSNRSATAVSKPWSLAARLTAWYALLIFLLVSGAATMLYWGVESSLTEEEDNYLNQRIQVLRSLLLERPGDAAGLKWVVESKPLGKGSSGNFARVLDNAGREVAEAPGMDDFLPSPLFPLPAAVDSEPEQGADVRTRQGKVFRVMSALARVANHRRKPLSSKCPSIARAIWMCSRGFAKSLR